MVTMEASSTTISVARTTTARMNQRFGSGTNSASATGIVPFVSLPGAALLESALFMLLTP